MENIYQSQTTIQESFNHFKRNGKLSKVKINCFLLLNLHISGIKIFYFDFLKNI
jgi:hypothetical protein